MTDRPLHSALHSRQNIPVSEPNHHHHHHHPPPPPPPHSHLHGPRDSELQPCLHSNGKMNLGKSNSSPMTSSDLPPLVGVPHAPDRRRNHQTTLDPSGIPDVCRGALECEAPVGPGTSSPLIRRRLKFMVRQCSDSELLKNNSSIGRLRIAQTTSGPASPVPHPPDQSPRSQNSSETNSPRILRKPHTLNSSRSGPSRGSRSLEGSPMVVRRTLGGVRRNSGDDSPSSSVPPSPPCSDQSQKLRSRPLSFGSYSDVLHYAGNSNDPCQTLTASTRGPASPFVVRRSVGLKGGVLLPPSRPDTPANDALSVHDSKKSYHLPSCSGERSKIQDNDETSLALEDCTDLEEAAEPRRRLRRDSGSQHAQRNSNSLPTDCSLKNLPKKSYVAAPFGISDSQHAPHYPHDEHGDDYVLDDDTGYPSNLYDIQERRESILSIEAVQGIARRFANNAEGGLNEAATDEDEEVNDRKRTFTKETIPEYKKEPLSSDKRVSVWLKGIQDPTERVPTNMARILPDIM